MPCGEVAEWLNATHSKCVMAQVIVGSNPTLSVAKVQSWSSFERLVVDVRFCLFNDSLKLYKYNLHFWVRFEDGEN